MTAFIDDFILQRTKKKLQEIKTVKELSQVLKDEEQIFWPTHKRHKVFIKTKRKNRDDPMSFLTELRKKAKFCHIKKL